MNDKRVSFHSKRTRYIERLLSCSKVIPVDIQCEHFNERAHKRWNITLSEWGCILAQWESVYMIAYLAQLSLCLCFSFILSIATTSTHSILNLKWIECNAWKLRHFSRLAIVNANATKYAQLMLDAAWSNFDVDCNLISLSLTLHISAHFCVHALLSTCARAPSSLYLFLCWTHTILGPKNFLAIFVPLIFYTSAVAADSENHSV